MFPRTPTPMHLRSIRRPALAALFALVLPHALTAQVDDPIRLRLEPCEIEGVGEVVECGTYTVLEDRVARSGRTIPLQVVVLRATGDEPEPEPVFVLVGGPGQAAAGLARGIARELEGVRERRDVVLVDIRGTGRSGPLRCQPESLQDRLGMLAFGLPDALLEECLARLEADPTRYITRAVVDDLDEVREALGYERIHLFGTSYGTRAAQVYLRRHPERVRSLVLRSVAPLGEAIPLLPPAHGQNALDRRWAKCAADEACRVEAPDPAGDLARVLERLAGSPESTVFVDPRSGDTTRVRITRDVFAGGIQMAQYSASFSERLPGIVHRAARGDFAPFLQVAVPMADMITGTMDLGLFFSITCTEDAPLVERLSAEAVERRTAGTFLGSATARNHARVCRVWPRGSVPAGYYDAVSSGVPVLLLSGEMDPITPPALADAVARHLPGSRHVIIPGAGHSPGGECVSGLIEEFLREGSAEQLETACVR